MIELIEPYICYDPPEIQVEKSKNLTPFSESNPYDREIESYPNKITVTGSVYGFKEGESYHFAPKTPLLKSWFKSDIGAPQKGRILFQRTNVVATKKSPADDRSSAQSLGQYRDLSVFRGDDSGVSITRVGETCPVGAGWLLSFPQRHCPWIISLLFSVLGLEIHGVPPNTMIRPKGGLTKMQKPLHLNTPSTSLKLKDIPC